MGKFRGNDLTGQKFSFLTVIEPAENTASGNRRWKCRCDCGKEVIRSARSLLDGMKKESIQSCGCKAPLAHQRHGMIRHPAYTSWNRMKERCYLPSNPSYKYYGGKGIEVCQRWKDSFEAFWEDMGPTWYVGASIDRIDTEKGYCPENCRWATKKEQANNRSTNSMVGELNVTQLAEKFQLPRGRIYQTLRYHPKFRENPEALVKYLTLLMQAEDIASRY